MDKKLNKVEQNIKEALKNIAEDLSGEESSKKWTSRIKEDICKLGKSSGFRIGASGCDGTDESEWVFDLIWWKEKERQELVLAMECEWSLSEDEIWRDF